MNKPIANRLFGPNEAFWDLAYQVTIIGLGIAASVAVYLEISGL